MTQLSSHVILEVSLEDPGPTFSSTILCVHAMPMRAQMCAGGHVGLPMPLSHRS